MGPYTVSRRTFEYLMCSVCVFYKHHAFCSYTGRQSDVGYLRPHSSVTGKFYLWTLGLTPLKSPWLLVFCAHIPPKASDFSLDGKNPHHTTCDIQWPAGSSGLKVESGKLNLASLGLELGIGPAVLLASLAETLIPHGLKNGRFCLMQL